MKKLLFLFLVCVPVLVQAKTDTTYRMKYYPDTSVRYIIVWTTETGKLTNISGLDSGRQLLYSYDVAENVLSTYNCIYSPICLDRRLRDSIINVQARMVGDERVNFLYNIGVDDTVWAELYKLGVLNTYNQVSYIDLGKDAKVRLEMERYDGGERVTYRHYFNYKKILSAWLNRNNKGWGVTYNYSYGKFDLLIFRHRRSADTAKQLSIVYTILPALMLLSVFLFIGWRMAKAKQYSEFYVFTTVLVLVSPLILVALRANEIALWLTLGLVISSAILSVYNMLSEKRAALVIWSIVYLVIISLALWLLWELAHTSWKVGG